MDIRIVDLPTGAGFKIMVTIRPDGSMPTFQPDDPSRAGPGSVNMVLQCDFPSPDTMTTDQRESIALLAQAIPNKCAERLRVPASRVAELMSVMSIFTGAPALTSDAAVGASDEFDERAFWVLLNDPNANLDAKRRAVACVADEALLAEVVGAGMDDQVDDQQDLDIRTAAVARMSNLRHLFRCFADSVGAGDAGASMRNDAILGRIRAVLTERFGITDWTSVLGRDGFPSDEQILLAAPPELREEMLAAASAERLGNIVSNIGLDDNLRLDALHRITDPDELASVLAADDFLPEPLVESRAYVVDHLVEQRHLWRAFETIVDEDGALAERIRDRLLERITIDGAVRDLPTYRDDPWNGESLRTILTHGAIDGGAFVGLRDALLDALPDSERRVLIRDNGRRALPLRRAALLRMTDRLELALLQDSLAPDDPLHSEVADRMRAIAATVA